MSTKISHEAQAVIDRIARHKYDAKNVDRAAIEGAINRHLSALNLPPRPFKWCATSKEGWGAARDAAWGAAGGAAWDAARGAARGAAIGAAELNALSAFNHPTQAKLVAIWLPMVDAFNAGLWLYWITPNSVICVDQPSLHIADNRLHREDGPAVEWPAGEAYYFWRGTSVPKEWIENRAGLTAKTALQWPNVEQRRAACEILGWHRVLSELKAKTIDKHDNPQVGELLEVSLPDAGKERFLRVLCGTNREFAIPVPKTMKTAIAAQAWTWGLSADEFQIPEVRT